MEEKKVNTLNDIKKHLRVTWSYQDEEIQSIIDEGKAFIEDICGSSDFNTIGPAFTMLRNYCRYAWSGSVELFEENYKRQLLRLQLSNGMRRFKEAKNGKKH